MEKEDLLKNLQLDSGASAGPDSIVACMRVTPDFESPFTDNVHTECSACGHAIVHRPHAPAVRKVCLECVLVEVGNLTETPEAQFQTAVTPASLMELFLLDLEERSREKSS